jgi:putative ABC transport system permease protein
VLKDIPDNSHLHFDFLFSRVVPDSSWTAYLNSWRDFEAYTYVLLNDQSEIESVKAKMSSFEKEHFEFAQGMLAVDFQPMKDIYLNSSQIEQSSQSQYGQRSYIYIFGSIGLFMLFIACINYINMTTSKAMSRAREIGVRKVAGAAKKQLVIQFLTESFVVAFIAMILSVGLMDLCFPYFNEITGKNFDITLENLSFYAAPLVGITILIAMLSGSYPAFYLARLKPVSSLKGKLVMNTGRVRLREALVVFQFALTVIMIVSTLVVGEQMKYIREKDMGYDKDQLMVIDINSGNVRNKFEAMKNEYAKIPGVSGVAVSSRVPGEWKNIVQLYAKPPQRADSMETYFMGFDEDMLETYEFQLAEGNYFSNNQAADSTHVVLNESAVKAFGLDEPVGATVRLKGNGSGMNATVIGVLKDFNFQSLHQKVEPIVIGAWNNPIQSIDYFTLKINGDREAVIASATLVHNQFDQRTPIEYHFLDEQLNSYYQAEARAGQIFRMGGLLSIFVACLGLFGLATYNIERRMKEMGIRKVLGATGANLFVLLSSSFAIQVGIAFLIAAPLAYFIMTKWLGAFAYRTSMHTGIFLLAGLMVLAIALLTISYRTLQAVYANPVKSLKEE